ncbi:hypothetical protein BN59_01675 [Legionella massiliensis]|uniref:Uncharacterized protein n=1 Tax=Legionella massiliensis TaxID=1034943 RepID=A0A078KWM5_9GAMM|nr:hypothetical protein [Legionella massiliensis]CDZ77392.1 hypothetical protein BN59_01675 [Legionella massiliensis]CEE13130.1 hypothetical protein BN1094_01675 [Legionella massiliensis]
MKNHLISGAALILACGIAQANVSTILIKSTGDNQKSQIRFTLNNQANADIMSDSALVPASAKVLAPQDAVTFSIDAPEEVGTQRIRYNNGNLGCDFYIDTQSQTVMPNMPPAFFSYVTAVPINAGTSCDVNAIGGVNHLAVSFMKFN